MERVIARCREQGLNPGYPLARDYPEHPNGLLIAITERRTRDDIDRLADAIGAAVAAERAGGRSEGAGMIREADDTLTIYERSRAGRRAFSPPETDVPERPLDELLPAGLQTRRAAAPARGLRARDRAPLQPPVQAQLRSRYRLLPARFVHDEAQPQAARAGRRHGGPRPAAPASGSPIRPGRARADVAPAGRARRDRRPAARLAPAFGRVARRAGRRAAHARAPRGPRRAPHQSADARHGPRDQPGDGDDGRLRGRQGGHRRERQRRPR